MAYVDRLERLIMAQGNKIDKLEQRMLAVEGRVKRVNHSREERRVEAGAWIKKILERTKAHSIGGVKIPDYAEHVMVILDDARVAGFNRVLVREARAMLGDSVVKVTHAPASKLWIWALNDAKHRKLSAVSVASLPVSVGKNKSNPARALIEKMLGKGAVRLERDLFTLAKSKKIKVSALLRCADDLGVKIAYTQAEGKQLKTWSL